MHSLAMFNGAVNSSANGRAEESIDNGLSKVSSSSDALLTIDEVQKTLNRSRASVYRYTNTDTRNLNPPFNPRKHYFFIPMKLQDLQKIYSELRK